MGKAAVVCGEVENGGWFKMEKETETSAVEVRNAHRFQQHRAGVRGRCGLRNFRASKWQGRGALGPIQGAEGLAFAPCRNLASGGMDGCGTDKRVGCGVPGVPVQEAARRARAEKRCRYLVACGRWNGEREKPRRPMGNPRGECEIGGRYRSSPRSMGPPNRKYQPSQINDTRIKFQKRVATGWGLI